MKSNVVLRIIVMTGMLLVSVVLYAFVVLKEVTEWEGWRFFNG